MTYSYTEKKRIRKNFGKFRQMMDVPYLLAIQLDSYRKFTQADTPLEERGDIGLHALVGSRRIALGRAPASFSCSACSSACLSLSSRSSRCCSRNHWSRQATRYYRKGPTPWPGSRPSPPPCTERPLTFWSCTATPAVGVAWSEGSARCAGDCSARDERSRNAARMRVADVADSVLRPPFEEVKPLLPCVIR